MAQLGVKNKNLHNIDWQKIDTVLLDLDGTLLDINFDMYFWLKYLPIEYAKAKNINHQQAVAKILPMLNKKKGKLEWYCLDYWQEILNIDIIQLKKNISHLIKILPNVNNFLDQLKAQNKQIILATNAHRKGLEIKLAKVGLENYFNLIISAHDYGAPKQNQLFWTKLSKQIKLNKNKAIFFDDSEDVIKSAKNFGIKNIIAISKPNSKKKAKNINGFINIEGFSEILPI